MNAAKQETKRYFTVGEANQRLPLVRSIVSDIVALFKDVHDRRERLGQMRQSADSIADDAGNVDSEELEQFEEELDQEIVRLEGYVGELQELGVELKDYVSGLVDFPAIIDGQEVYLCWKLGEDGIGFWHHLDTGFSGRQPLLEDSLSGDSSNAAEDVN